MKKTLTALTLALAAMTATAQEYPEHNAPPGYQFLIDGSRGDYVYIHLGSIKPQTFTSGAPARLAVASFWEWPKKQFHRFAANCDSMTYSRITANGSGTEQTGEWKPAIDGTVAHMMTWMMCEGAYRTKKPAQRGQTL